jgi:hypothetical protein
MDKCITCGSIAAGFYPDSSYEFVATLSLGFETSPLILLQIANWYETLVEIEVNDQDRMICWQERRLIIQSIDGGKAAQISLQERLEKAEKAIRELMVRKQGKPRLTSRVQVEEQVQLGNPKRRTAQPTTERLLEAFNEITLTIVSGPGFVQRHLPPLSAL